MIHDLHLFKRSGYYFGQWSFISLCLCRRWTSAHIMALTLNIKCPGGRLEEQAYTGITTLQSLHHSLLTKPEHTHRTRSKFRLSTHLEKDQRRRLRSDTLGRTVCHNYHHLQKEYITIFSSFTRGLYKTEETLQEVKECQDNCLYRIEIKDIWLIYS